MASCKRLQVGGDSDEKPPVRFRGAGWRRGHENRPFELACCGLAAACTALGLGVSRGDEGQRRHPVARARGHVAWSATNAPTANSIALSLHVPSTLSNIHPGGAGTGKNIFCAVRNFLRPSGELCSCPSQPETY